MTRVASRIGLVSGSVALVLVGIFAVRHLTSWPTRLRYPGDWCSVEGIFLAEMLHLRQGVPIYSPFSPERFDAANYGPLYFLLGAKLTDPQAPAFFRLRLLSTLATVGCAAACALLAFWLSRSYFAGVLAPLLFLAQALVTYYGTSARCDSVALLLFFLGWLVAFRFQNSRAIFLAVPLMLLGSFYKPQFLSGPCAVVLSLLLQKRYRRAAEFAAALGLGGVGLLVFFQFWAFPGQEFLEHFLKYNLLPFSWSRLASGFPVFGIMFLVPLLVGLEYLRQYPDTFLRCYLGCAVLFALLPVGRQGSDTNYFLECALLLSPLFAALIAKNLGELHRAAELIVLLSVTLLVGQLFTTDPPRREDFARDRAVQDFLRRNFPPPAAALSYYTGDLVRAGLDVPISNLFHSVWLIRKGTFSERPLLDQLQRRRFQAIVVNHDLRNKKAPDEPDSFLTEAMRQAILTNYQVMTELEMPGPEKFHSDDRFYVWVPRSGTQAVEPAASNTPGPARER
jgi:hypothetical protein